MSKIYAVEYHYVTDRDEEMAELRPSHRAFNGALADRGLLLAAGPYVARTKRSSWCAPMMRRAR